MRAYIGAKIIMAEPMDEITFGRQFRKTTPDENQETRPGYHVQYSNPDGTTYDSWSPRDVFERAYRPIEKGEAAQILGI